MGKDRDTPQCHPPQNNLNYVLDCSKFTVKTVVRTCHNKKNVNELLNNLAASAILNLCCVV